MKASLGPAHFALARTLRLLVAVVCMIVPFRAALAQDAPAVVAPPAAQAEQAQQAFLRGSAMLDQHNAAGALVEFDQAIALVDSPNARLYRARALTILGRYADAVEAYERTARDAEVRARTEARFAPTRSAALEEMRRIEPRVARVIVRVTEMPPGLRLRVAGRDVPLDQVGNAVVVEPGSVEVVAEAPGRPPRRQIVDARVGRPVTVQLAIAESASAASAPLPTGDSTASGARRVPTVFLVASIASLGVGALGYGLSVGFFAAASARYQQLERDCGASPCPESLRGAVDEGRSLQTATNALFVLGTVGVLAGGALLTVGLVRSRRTEAAVAITPSGFSFAGRF